MKALLRNDDIIPEGFPGIDWNTGAPLTNAFWCGGPYTLVDNFVEPVKEEDGDGHVPAGIVEEPVQEAAEEPDDDYVIIDGIKYKKC